MRRATPVIVPQRKLHITALTAAALLIGLFGASLLV